MPFIKLKDLWPIGNRLIIRFKPVEEKTRCKLSRKRRCVNTSSSGQEMKASFNNKLPTQTKGDMVKQLNPEILKSVIQTRFHEKCPFTFNPSKVKRHFLYQRNLSEKDDAFMASMKIIPVSNSSSSV